jgi:hypothetical protein
MRSTEINEHIAAGAAKETLDHTGKKITKLVGPPTKLTKRQKTQYRLSRLGLRLRAFAVNPCEPAIRLWEYVNDKHDWSTPGKVTQYTTSIHD